MAKKDLIKNEDLTPQQRRENARKAGKASAEKRRQKKKMKEAMTLLMDLPVIKEQHKEVMKAMGIEDSEMTNQMLIAVSALNKAIKGDVKAMVFINDVLGGRNMNDLDKANMERIKAETKRIKAETKKIESAEGASKFDAEAINELNHDILSNVAPNRKLEDFE